MSGPLRHLFWRTRRNALVRFVRGLKSPKRLVGTVATTALLAFLAYAMAQQGRFADTSSAPALLTIYLAFTLVMSFFGGFLEPGLPFTPSEIEFLLAGPFPLRSLILYRVTSLYPINALSALLPLLLFGLPTRHPVLALVGIVLCGFVALHVRLFVAVLAVRIDEALMRRLRGPLRIVSLVVSLGLIGLIAGYMTYLGGARSIIVAVAANPAAQILFFPAAAASRMAMVDHWTELGPSLLGSLAFVVGTLMALLALRVNFIEASLNASERLAARRARFRRGGGVAALESVDRRAAAGHVPTLRVFRGAGAVAWKNLLMARRSWRTLLFRLLLSALFVPAFLIGKGDAWTGLAAVALFPILLMSAIGYDFRGERPHMPRLKALPASRWGLALAEVAVPTALALTLQLVLLVVLASLGRVPAWWVPLLLLGYAPVTAACVAAANTAHLVAPKGPAAGILQLVLIGVNLLVVVLLGAWLQSLGAAWPVVFAAPWLLELMILATLLWWIGVAFAAFDVTADAA